MKTIEINSQIQRLRNLFDKSTEIQKKIDLETFSNWTKYLCVLSAGLLENALPEIFSQYSKKSSNDRVASYASDQLNRIQNPNAERFIGIAQSFDKRWGENLKKYLIDDGGGSAINSIMSNRHNIAHGKNSSITLVQLKEHLEKSIKVLEFLEKECGL